MTVFKQVSKHFPVCHWLKIHWLSPTNLSIFSILKTDIIFWAKLLYWVGFLKKKKKRIFWKLIDYFIFKHIKLE